jgi:hypothetical protein
MKNSIRLSAALLSVVAVGACFCAYSKDSAEAATRPQEPQKPAMASQQSAASTSDQPASVDPEALYGPSFAFLAWNLFLHAMEPAGDSLTFETWTEQCQLKPNMIGCPSAASVAAAAARAGGNGKVRLLHGSAMARSRKIAGSDCGAMTTTSLGGYPPPSNLTRNAMYCEEVFVNPVEAAFVKRELPTLVSQLAYGNEHNGTINFPGTETNDTRFDLDSLEVKVDWVPATSFNPTFACPDPTNSLYTETINGTCYALAAIHITSKVMPKWIWATFEPNSNITNPNRCDAKLYNTCLDPWGTTSSQPYGKGQTAQQSQELHQAMAEAHLNPAFSNYFLTGVQTQFVDNYGKPIPMGNSFVEFNQGVPPGKSSCITCHQYATFDGKQPPQGEPEANFGRPPHGWPSIGYACNQNQDGNCMPETPHSTTQDFSWILGLMPYSDAVDKMPADKSQSPAKN